MAESKKRRREQTFLSEYTTRWPVIVPSDKGKTYARCTECNSSFSISHGGGNDIKTHVSGARHIKNCNDRVGQQNIKTFCQDFDKSLDQKAIHAELLWTNFLVEHNVATAASDHFGSLMKEMFPDSKIAHQIKCGHTKAASLINFQAQSAVNYHQIIGDKKQPYTLCTDGSNDSGDKLYPIIVRYVGHDNLIKEDLLSVPCVTEASATGENIFLCIDSDLQDKGLTWDNCIAIGSDNAPVMSGNKKGTLRDYVLSDVCVPTTVSGHLMLQLLFFHIHRFYVKFYVEIRESCEK